MSKLPLSVKIILLIICPYLVIPIWIITSAKTIFTFASQENKLFSELVNNPCEENARAYINVIRNAPKVTLSPENTPNAWAVLREKWQIINQSNKIPSDMKKEIFDFLVQRGLYVSNSKIINNYKSRNISDADNMQDEMNRQFNDWSMEESKKAVTPFDHGGYVQGDGFNPSDTMAADAQRQIDNMNQTNNMF